VRSTNRCIPNPRIGNFRSLRSAGYGDAANRVFRTCHKRWLQRGSGAQVLLAFPLGIPVGMNESGIALTGVRVRRGSRLGIAAGRRRGREDDDIRSGIRQYREIKPYWTKRFAKVSVPFELRLLNGMNPPVPEVTVLIHRIKKDRRAGEYRLHIKKVLGFKHWDKRRQKPKR